jgi:tetratricopeptide (TPR) repeat protein
MLGSNKNTILQNAQKYTAKGQIEKAIEEWQKLIAETPNDGNIYNTIGDLYLKTNKIPNAIDAYFKAASTFHEAGFALKTIAVYKKILKLDPERIEVYLKLADLNAERGLASNAIEDYLAVARHLTKANRFRESLEVYRKIANLDPGNVGIRIKVAEICLKEGMQPDAIQELLLAAKVQSEAGKKTEAQEIYKRILQLDPKQEEALNGLRSLGVSSKSPEPQLLPMEALIAKVQEEMGAGGFEQADRLARQAIRREPGNPAHQVLLGTVLLKKGDHAAAASAVQSAAKMHIEKSQFREAALVLKEYLKQDERNFECRELLAEVYEKSGNTPMAIGEYAGLLQDQLRQGDSARAVEFYERMKRLDPKHPTVRQIAAQLYPQAESSAAEASQSGIGGRLDVSKSGTGAKSAGPSEMLEETGEAPPPPRPTADPAVIEGYLTEAEVYQKYGLTAKAIELLEKVREMDAENFQALLQLRDLYRSGGETEPYVRTCLRLSSLYLRKGDAKSRNQILSEALEVVPDHPRLKAAFESGVLEISQPEEPAAASPPAAAETEPQTETGSLSGSLTPADLDEKLAEADFYFQQGLKDEAKKVYETILTLYPDHIEAQSRLNEIRMEEIPERSQPSMPSVVSEGAALEEAMSMPSLSREASLSNLEHALDAPSESEASPEPKEEGYFDLSQILEEEPAAAAASQPMEEGDRDLEGELNDIFAQFQKGVREQVGMEDFETHYDLGIAYKEMGLLNEALGEFEICLRSPERGVDAALMMAVCYQDKGQSAQAIKLLEGFRRQLTEGRYPQDKRLWLLYELGLQYEKAGRFDQASEVYRAIQQEDGSFRDIGERLRRLSGKQSTAAPAESDEPPEMDFERLLQEVMEREDEAPTPTGPGGGAAKRKSSESSGKRKGKISYL